MRFFLWLIGGTVLVSAAFFLPGGAQHIWQSLLFSGVAAVIFLMGLLIFYQHDASENRMNVGLVCGTLVILFAVYGWVSYQKAEFHEQTLTDIREQIETEIAKTHINEALLSTLRTYYSVAGEQLNRNLGTVFRTLYSSKIDEEGTITFNPDDDESLAVLLDKATPDSIVLVAYSSYVPGESESFKNINGQKGLIQARGILTKGGISYEREN